MYLTIRCMQKIHVCKKRAFLLAGTLVFGGLQLFLLHRLRFDASTLASHLPTSKTKSEFKMSVPGWSFHSNQERMRGSRNGKPIFVLHVGLPKTATTFIQCSLCENSNLTDPILESDNLVYLGTCPSESCHGTQGSESGESNQYFAHSLSSFFVDGRTAKDVVGWGPRLHDSKELMSNVSAIASNVTKLRKGLRRFVHDLSARNANGLIVFEGFHCISSGHIEALSVKVVVAYRPLYQWLPSKYNSVMKPSRFRNANYWPRQQGSDDEGMEGLPIPPFALKDRGGFSEMVQYLIHLKGLHPAEVTARNYKQYFDHVDIMPFHQLHASGRGDPKLEHLFCTVFKKGSSLVTKHTCDAVRRGAISTETRNPTYDLNYDMIAVAAYQAGLFRVDGTSEWVPGRQGVAKRVRKIHQDTMNRSTGDFEDIVCFPHADLDTIESVSLAAQEQIFGRDQDAAKSHRALFQKSIRGHNTVTSMPTRQ